MGFLGRLRGLWRAILNKFVSGMEDQYVIELAEMKLQEATERLKEGRQGLTTYQALVLKVQGQVDEGQRKINRLTAEIKAHLKAGNEAVAGQMVLDLSQAKQDLDSNREQLSLHQQAYENNLMKMKTAIKDIQNTRNELDKKKAALQMERALAEVAEAAGALNTTFDVSSDFGQVMGRLDDKINQAKARSKVAADLSGEGTERIKAREAAEKAMAQELLQQFKIEEGLAEPPVGEPAQKTMGPAQTTPQKTTTGED